MPGSTHFANLFSSTGEYLTCVANGLANLFNDQLVISERTIVPDESEVSLSTIAAGALTVSAIGAGLYLYYKKNQSKSAATLSDDSMAEMPRDAAQNRM